MLKSSGFILRGLLEAGLFAALPSAFLASYVAQHHAPLTSVWPHYRWIAMFWLALLLLRLLFNLGLPLKWARFLSSIILTLGFFGLLLYYAIILIGLNSWGKVTSLDLMATYAMQLSELCEALGIAYLAVVAALVALFLLISVLSYFYLRNSDWVLWLARIGTPRIRAEIIFALAVIIFVCFWRLAQFVDVGSAEPIMLTLHPEYGTKRLQSHHVSKNGKLDELENQVRAEYRAAPSPMRRNVFIIVVDALRADHMSLYGYKRRTTPYLDTLADSGQAERPGRLYSVCAESSCGLMGLASSRYAHRLPERPITLQEVLMLHGYERHMMLGGDHTHFYGLREAYGKLNSYYDGSMAKGRYMNDDRLVTDRLTQLEDWNGMPVFMQFHLMSSHGLGRRLPEFEKFQPAKSYYADLGARILLNRYTPDQNYINFYDNGVLQTDYMIHRILQMLEKKRYLKDALVVVTGDHGELLGEHGYYAHAHTVYEPVLNIPFLMLRYGYESKAHIPREAVVSQIDIAPTILAELEIPAPHSWSGLALQMSSQAVRDRRFIYFQQESAYGLLDLKQGAKLWKYTVNARERREWGSDVSMNRDERVDQLQEVPTVLKEKWIQQLLELQMSAHEYASDPAEKDQIPH